MSRRTLAGTSEASAYNDLQVDFATDLVAGAALVEALCAGPIGSMG